MVRLVELPIIIKSEGKGNNVLYYLGNDPAHDEYKVLSIVWEVKIKQRVVRSEDQVLVLGAGASWKTTQCHITHIDPMHHRPSQGISINGVLYYGAWTDAHRYVLMSFDLSSDEFNLNELPNVPIFQNLNLYRTSLMNYKGRVDVFDCWGVLWDPRVDVWVIEDADKKTIVLPVSQMNFDLTLLWLMMGGINHSGKVWLIKAYLTPNQPTRFSIYDLERNEITPRIEIRSSLRTSCIWKPKYSTLFYYSFQIKWRYV